MLHEDQQSPLEEDILAFLGQQRKGSPGSLQEEQTSPPEDIQTFMGQPQKKGSPGGLQEEQTSPPENDILAFLGQSQSGGAPGGLLALPGLGEDEDEDDGQAAVLPPRTPWWRRRGSIIGFILLVLLLLGIIFSIFFLNRKQPVQFQKTQVTQGNVSLTISATGPLQGGTYNINFSGTGKIAEIDVKVGQHVNKGQVVAKLDPTSLQDAVNQAQAAYNAALTALNADLANSGAT